MKCMAMLPLAFLVVFTQATDCIDPPVPATRDWVNEVVKSGCTVVDGDLHLGANCTDDSCPGPAPSLADSVDLGFVKTITGRLTCYGNSGIITVTANDLTSAGAVEIATATLDGAKAENLQMTSLALPALVDVSGDVLLLGNPDLTSVGIGALQTVGGDLRIRVNDALASMGMHALQAVGGYLRIETNRNLTSVGMHALHTVGGYLNIGFNGFLTSVGMGALQTIGGYLEIGFNPDLTAVGMDALRTVGGYLCVKYNVALAAVGMGALETVGGDLRIRGNKKFTFTISGCFDSSILDRTAGAPVIEVEGYSCSPTSSSPTAVDVYEAAGYMRVVKGCVKGHNIKLIKSQTVPECALLCDASPGCKGFEYGMAYGGENTYVPGDCQLQSSADAAGCDGADYNLDFYKKVPTPGPTSTAPTTSTNPSTAPSVSTMTPSFATIAPSSAPPTFSMPPSSTITAPSTAPPTFSMAPSSTTAAPSTAPSTNLSNTPTASAAASSNTTAPVSNDPSTGQTSGGLSPAIIIIIIVIIIIVAAVGVGGYWCRRMKRAGIRRSLQSVGDLYIPMHEGSLNEA